MSWLLAWPGRQQLWCWLYMITGLLLSMWRNFSHAHLAVENTFTPKSFIFPGMIMQYTMFHQLSPLVPMPLYVGRSWCTPKWLQMPWFQIYACHQPQCCLLNVNTVTGVILNPLIKQCSREVGSRYPVGFFVIWRVRFLTAITLHALLRFIPSGQKTQ